MRKVKQKEIVKFFDIKLKNLDEKELSISEIKTPYLYFSILQDSFNVDNIEHFIELNSHAEILYEQGISTCIIFNDSVKELQKKIQATFNLKISDKLYVIGTNDTSIRNSLGIINGKLDELQSITKRNLHYLNNYISTIEYRVLNSMVEAQNHRATIKNGYDMLLLQAEKSWQIWNQ